MAWQTIYSQKIVVDNATEVITLPINLQPYFRLVVNTELLTGLGENEPTIGSLIQLLSIPDVGKVNGQTLALSPNRQLLVPASEFPYNLAFRPVRHQYSLELSIQAETTIKATDGADIGPVLAAIANLEQIISQLPTPTAGNDNGPVLAAIANLQQLISDLPDSTGAPDYSQVLAGLQISLDEIRGDVAGVAALLATNGGQGDLVEQLQQLQQLQSLNHAETTATLAAIADLLNSEAPPIPSALNAAYTASQSSTFGSLVATYGNLTDGSGITGGATNTNNTQWIQATFDQVVSLGAITVGGGTLPGWGGVALYLNGRTLQSSPDGVSWATLWTVSGVTDSGPTQFVTHQLPERINVKACRLLVNSNYISTTEFKFS